MEPRRQWVSGLCVWNPSTCFQIVQGMRIGRIVAWLSLVSSLGVSMVGYENEIMGLMQKMVN